MRYDAETLLQQWGLWQRTGRDRLGYKSPMGELMKQAVHQSSATMPWIDEADVEQCDVIVTRLGRTNRLCADALIAYYCTNRTQHGVGIVLGITRRRVGELLEMGKMYVQSSIDEKVLTE